MIATRSADSWRWNDGEKVEEDLRRFGTRSFPPFGPYHIRLKMVGNPQGGVVRVVIKIYIKWGATYSNIKFISWGGITVTEKEVDGNVFDYKQTYPGFSH